MDVSENHLVVDKKRSALNKHTHTHTQMHTDIHTHTNKWFVALQKELAKINTWRTSITKIIFLLLATNNTV